MLSAPTPLNPFERADELDLALLLLALVVVPGATAAVTEELASRAPVEDRDPRRGPGRRVTRPGAGVRPPRSC